MDGLRFNARDISYWVHKKTGFINFEDEGLLAVSFDNRVSFRLGSSSLFISTKLTFLSCFPQGISFDIELENASETDRESFFVVKSVHVDISDLEYAISRNKSWLLWLASGTVGGLIKKVLKSSLESQVRPSLHPPQLPRSVLIHHLLFSCFRRSLPTSETPTSSSMDFRIELSLRPMLSPPL